MVGSRANCRWPILVHMQKAKAEVRQKFFRLTKLVVQIQWIAKHMHYMHGTTNLPTQEQQLLQCPLMGVLSSVQTPA